LFDFWRLIYLLDIRLSPSYSIWRQLIVKCRREYVMGDKGKRRLLSVMAQTAISFFRFFFVFPELTGCLSKHHGG